ncbi:IS1 family transposase [Spirosoma utsteinense]|uniref:IS1 family transposase n=1 Tax=Spirosoma utsteinense TaxID=2585773 RepID=UPI001645FFBA
MVTITVSCPYCNNQEAVRRKGVTSNGHQPHRFLWITQGLVHNFCHIFQPGVQRHKPGGSAYSGQH